MIKVKIPYLDGEFVVEEEEPTTLAEVTNQLSEFQVLKKFIKHLRYHYKYRRVYAEVAKRLEPAFARTYDTDTDMEYLDRYLKSGNPEARENLQRLFNEIAPNTSLVAMPERRETKVSQGALEAATQSFAKGNQETVATNIENALIDYEIQRDVNGHITLEGLARGIQRLNRQLIRQATQQSKTITT